jgi:orotate phosphoribosyltransferase
VTVDRIESVLQLHGRSDIDILLARYLSPSEAGGDGGPTAGSVNIRRLYGHPADFRVVVRAMAGTVPSATGAIGSADVDSIPLATAVAWTLGLPAVYVRDEPRQHLVSYGEVAAPDGESLIGERLEPETVVHVLDDRVTTGETAERAVALYRGAGLVVDEMSVVLGGAPEEQLVQLAANLSLTILHVLVRR